MRILISVYDKTGLVNFLSSIKDHIENSHITLLKNVLNIYCRDFHIYLRVAIIIFMELETRIPELISLNDIKGDLHLHTKESDGLNTTEEMVNAALEKRYEYIAMTHP